MNAKELESRLKSLAYRIVNVCDALPKKKISKVIEDQLLRSSFSAAANYRAACKAISKRAFVSKLSIAFEESDETLFWSEVILELKLIPVEKLSAIIKEATELASILAAARKTAQSSLK
jgi:four helix bundle protein